MRGPARDMEPTRHRVKLSHLTVALLLLGLSAAAGAPVANKSLEQAPTDLKWDDWIKQEHQPDDIPPRRITTKSLFVFPNLGTDSLPACAEGYRPDSMGRCVKNVKINESAHLEFLLQKLNSQFSPSSPETGSDEVYDYDADGDGDGEPSDGPGPFQVNIPLALPHSGHKNDENEPGEYVHVSKKDPQSSPPDLAPQTSNTHQQFFPGGPPAETPDVLSSHNSPAAGGLSILIPSLADKGSTVIVPGNNKIQQVFDQEGPAQENSKPAVHWAGSDAVGENVDANRQAPAGIQATPQSGGKERNKDQLIAQIESLKAPEQTSPSQPLRPVQDIEEKIKIISQFADVSRNTDHAHPPYKKPPNDFVRFPDNRADFSHHSPQHVDLLPVPSTSLHPVNTNGMPVPPNYPADDFEHFQPIVYNNDEKYKPYWLPYGWDTYRTPNGEDNLIDFWHKISTAQRYPYNVRFHQQQAPTQHPTLYPSAQKTPNRHLGLVPVNYRQGREDNVRRYRLYQDDSINYKRSVHPQVKMSPSYWPGGYGGR